MSLAFEVSLQSKVCAMVIIWSGLGRVSSGRQLLRHIWGTSNICLYLSACPTLRLSSKPLVNDVLRDMINKLIFVYLDDILIYSCSFQVYIQHIRRVLQWLPEKQFCQKLGSAFFMPIQFCFLGPGKVKAVYNWSTTVSRKDLRDLPVFICVLSGILVSWRLLWRY